MTDAIDYEQAGGREADRTIRVSDRDVAEARRLLSLLADAEANMRTGTGPEAEVSAQAFPPGALLGRARALLAARRQREALFGKTIFGEPAWDILLLLYVGTSESRRTIGRLAKLARISKSTALRWIDYLDRHGLVRREPHPTDKRAVFVDLTKRGSQAIGLYLSGTFALTE